MEINLILQFMKCHKSFIIFFLLLTNNRFQNIFNYGLGDCDDTMGNKRKRTSQL